MFKKSFLTMAIVSVLAAGCSNSSNDPEVTQASKVSGSVAKGIVKQGIVTAYALDAQGAAGAAVGTATTDNKGLYTLTLSDSYDGTSPLLIELTAGDDTTMVCDSRDGCGTGTAFGADIPLADTGFKLTAMSASVADGKTVTTSITPFTSMAASNITADGTFTDAAILAKNASIGEPFNINITQTTTLNIADDLSNGTAEEQRYAVMLSALAKQAFKDSDADGGVDIDDVIANLDNFNNDAKDTNLGSTDGLNLVELFTDAASEIENPDSTVSDDVGLSITSLANNKKVKAEENGGVIDLVEVSGENPTEVAQAKILVRDVRTWASGLEGLQDSDSAKLFQNEAGTISDTLDANSQAVLEIFSMALSAVANEIDNARDAGTALPSSIQLIDNDTVVGDINLTDNSTANSTVIVMSSSDLNGVSANATVSVNSGLPTDSIAAGDLTLNVNGSASNSEIALSLSNAAYTMSLTEAVTIGNDDDNDDKGDEPPLAGMSLVAQLSAESLDNGTATGEKITADVEIKLVALNENAGPSLKNDMNLNIEKIALTNLAVTNSEGSTGGLSVSLVMNNATSFDAVSYLNYEPVVEKGIRNDFDVDDIDFSAAEELFGISIFYNLEYNVYGAYFDNAFQSGPHTCGNGADANNTFVDWKCFEGDAGLSAEITPKYSSYAHVSNVTLKDFDYTNDRVTGYVGLSGRVELVVDDMETAENFLDATLSITGKVDLDDYPEAVLSVTAKKTGIETGNLEATLSYDDKALNLSANTNGGGEENTDASLVFSNAAGTKMTIIIDEGWTSGNVTVDDKEVGTIDNLDGGLIMRYNDGTFESL